METSTYRIGHVYICITMPEDMPRPENLSRFLVRYEEKEEFSGEECIHYTLEYTDDISTIQEDVQKEQLGDNAGASISLEPASLMQSAPREESTSIMSGSIPR